MAAGAWHSEYNGRFVARVWGARLTPSSPSSLLSPSFPAPVSMVILPRQVHNDGNKMYRWFVRTYIHGGSRQLCSAVFDVARVFCCRSPGSGDSPGITASGREGRCLCIQRWHLSVSAWSSVLTRARSCLRFRGLPPGLGAAARTNHGEGRTEGTLSPGDPALPSHPGLLRVHFIPYTGMEVGCKLASKSPCRSHLRRRKGNGRTRKPETS